MALVQWLVDEKPEFGAGGCLASDFDECKGTVVGQGGYIFDLTINIFRTEDTRKCNVASVDLGKCLEGYEPESYHAMFCQFQRGDEMVLRNSWGTSHEYISLPHESPAIRARWCVKVTNFVWRRKDEFCEDVTFCEGGAWFTDDCEWPFFGEFFCEGN